MWISQGARVSRTVPFKPIDRKILRTCIQLTSSVEAEAQADLEKLASRFAGKQRAKGSFTRICSQIITIYSPCMPMSFITGSAS